MKSGSRCWSSQLEIELRVENKTSHRTVLGVPLENGGTEA
jgi:hypothetical protein